MAVILTDHRTIWNEADSITGWTGTTTLGTTDPAPIESTGWVGASIGVAIVDSFFTAGSPVNLSDAVIYAWVFSRLSLGNTADANGGLMIYTGDGAGGNTIAYKVAGADRAAFRHDTGPTGWQCPALDTTNLPASPLVRTGSAPPTWGSISSLGTTVNSLVAAPGMNPNYNADIIRVLFPANNNGCAISITGGTSGDPGTFAQIAAADRATGNQQAHGIVREYNTGAYGCQGPLRFGDATGSSSTWFEDKNATFIFENRGFRSTLYKFFITDNGTGTATFRLGTKVGTGVNATGADGCNITAAPGVGWQFDADTDTDVTDVFIYGSTFNGASGGVGLQAGHEFIGGVISASGTVRSGGATMVNSRIINSLAATNTSALIWNVATDPDGFMDGMSFSKGTNAHHAIEFGLTSPVSITLRGIDFSGFSASTNVDSSAFHIKRTTGTVTINLVGCTSDVSLSASYRSDGATVVIVEDPVTTLITVVDEDDVAVPGAAVYLVAGSGGPLTPGTVIINGLTNSSGQISDTRTLASNQPIDAVNSQVICGSKDIPYEPAAIKGTINSTTGLTLTITLKEDT